MDPPTNTGNRSPEEKKDSASDGWPTGLLIYDAQGTLREYNSACCEIFGMEQSEEDSGGFHQDRQLPDALETCFQNRETRSVIVSYDFDLVREKRLYPTWKRGVMQLDAVVTPMRNREGGCVFGVMVRERGERREEHAGREEARKQVEAERGAFWERMERILSRMPIGCILNDEHFRFTYWNPAAEGIFGYLFEEVKGKHPFETITPGESQPLVQDVFRRLRHGDMSANGTSEHRTKDGRTILCEWNNTPLYNAEGDFRGIVSMCRDITERKQAEERLRESEALYSSLVENLPQAIFRKDFDGRFTFGNRNFCRYIGTTPQELLGKTDSDFFPPEIADKFIEDDRHVMRSGGILQMVEENRSLQSPDARYAQVVKTPLYDLDGKIIGVQGICWDITEIKRAEEERQRLEEQLRQSQKMESIGRLAGGVAHDFNNLLMAIIGYSDILADRLTPTDPAYPFLREIRKAGERARSLTAQLLAFSRKQVLQPKALNLNALILDMKNMLQRLIGEPIHLLPLLQDDLGTIKADRNQIEQVILNLVVNARDAMEKGGKLVLQTRNAVLDEGFCREHVSMAPGPYVQFTVLDTGVGMESDTLEKIFEPFYTTKDKSKGTGLGLSTVYGIVRQSGGAVQVSSCKGVGTRFDLYLPRVEAPAEEPDEMPRAGLSPRGTETILVVEDEPVVRRLVSSSLRRKGYRVIEMVHGRDALQFCLSTREPLHLLLTDVLMPEMSGRELYDRLVEANRVCKVLFMSGYTDDAVLHHGVSAEAFPFLQKPFAPDSLLRKVREILDEE